VFDGKWSCNCFYVFRLAIFFFWSPINVEIRIAIIAKIRNESVYNLMIFHNIYNLWFKRQNTHPGSAWVKRYYGTFLKFTAKLFQGIDNQVRHGFREDILGANLDDTGAFSLRGRQ